MISCRTKPRVHLTHFRMRRQSENPRARHRATLDRFVVSRRHRLKRLLDNFRLRRIRKCVSGIIWEVSLKRTTNVRKCFSEPPSLFRKSRKRDCFQVPSSAARTPARAGRGPAALFFRGRRPRRTMRSTEVAHGAGDAQGTSRTAVPDSPSRILVFRRHPRDGPIHRSRRDSLTAPPYPRPF